MSCNASASVLADIANILGLLFFSGWQQSKVRFSGSKSFHSTYQASPNLIAVSFNVSKNAAMFFPETLINASISVSWGNKR
jgi:hypothetical protein